MYKDIEEMLLICGYQVIFFLFQHDYPLLGEYKGKYHEVRDFLKADN